MKSHDVASISCLALVSGTTLGSCEVNATADYMLDALFAYGGAVRLETA